MEEAATTKIPILRGRKLDLARGGPDQNEEGSASDSDSASDPWKDPQVSVVNTFIQVVPPMGESVRGFLEVRRKTSDPLSSRSSSQSSSLRASGDEGAANSGSERARRISMERSRGSSKDAAKGSSESSDRKGTAQDKERADEHLHQNGMCKPCAFVNTDVGCAMGAECRFCHLPHEHTGKLRLRPCRGKRLRTKRLFDRLGNQAAKDPESFNVETLDLPPSVEKNATMKARLLEHLVDCVDKARASSSASADEEGRS